MVLRRNEDIAFGADLGLQRHHDALAQAVDRRIRDLGELLPEIIVERADFLRQHRHRRVVAHRADRFALVLGQNADDLVALLGGHVVHLLEHGKGVAIEGLRREPRIDEIGLQIPHALLQPRLVGMPALQEIVHPLGVHELGGLQIERQHLARSQLALLDHLFGEVVPHPRLRGDGDVPVLRDDPARRTQPIAVQGAADIAAVGEHDAGRPVPGLHVGGVVLVEGLEVGIDHVHRLPRRRHQHPHGMHGIEAADQQQFEHVVERLRVRTLQRHHRQNVGQIGQHRRAEQGAARHRPAAVALHRVDLTIVGEISIGMGQAPLRHGVGGETLVEDHHRGFHPRILEIGIELRQELRHHHALVDDGAGGQRRYVENRIVRFQPLFGAPPRQVQLAVEGRLVDVAAPVHEHLLDGGQGLERLRAAGLRVHRQGAKTRDRQFLQP